MSVVFTWHLVVMQYYQKVAVMYLQTVFHYEPQKKTNNDCLMIRQQNTKQKFDNQL